MNSRPAAGARAAFRGAFILCMTALAIIAPAAIAKDQPVPPPDQAVLDTYTDWSAYLRQRGETARASEVDARARKLKKACRTSTSVFIGFDPYSDLQDFARDLAAAGEEAKAREVQAVALSYRKDQIRRLMMHGGKILDPARYMGRPADYERKLVSMRELEETIEGPGFSARRPPGEDWELVSHESMPLIFSKVLSSTKEQRARGQSFVVVITLLNPAFALNVSAADFPQAFEAHLRDTTQDRFRLISVTATHRGASGEYCADYDLTMEEREHPDHPGGVLEIWNHGFVCLDVSLKFVVDAYYSERRLQGEPTMVSESHRDEAEVFLRSAVLTPRQGE